MMDAQGAIGCALAFTPDGRRLIATDSGLRVSMGSPPVADSSPPCWWRATAGLIGMAFRARRGGSVR